MYVVRSHVSSVLSLLWNKYLNFLFPNIKLERKRKAEASKDTELVDPQDVSVIKAVSPLKNCPSSARVSASVNSAAVSSLSDLDKRLDNLQDEWATLFARNEALLTMNTKTDVVFSPVKAPVHKARSPVASVSKMPFFYPFVSDRSGPDQVPEDRQDFKMTSPLENLYGESNLECEPLFSTTSGAPASSAAGPEVDDREDIPDLESSASSSSDNPWAGGCPQPVGKISVAFSAEEWLCQKIEDLNCTTLSGYRSKSMEAGGFQSDQFLKPPKSQLRWYDIHKLPDSATARPGRSVHYWSSDASKLNSLYSRVAKASGTGLVHSPCRPLPQETVRKW